jgi:hypothetical protein
MGASGGIRTHKPVLGAVFEFSGRQMSPPVLVRERRKYLASVGFSMCLCPWKAASVGVKVVASVDVQFGCLPLFDIHLERVRQLVSRRLR